MPLTSLFIRVALKYKTVRTDVSHDSSVLTKLFTFLFMLAHNERFITNLVCFMEQTEQGTFFGVSGTVADPVKWASLQNVLKNISDLRYTPAVTRNVRNERRTLDNSTEKKCVLYMCCIMLPNEVLLFQVTWRLRVRCGLRAAHVLHCFMYLPGQSLKVKLQKYI